MAPSPTFNSDPRLDLVLERAIDVPRELVWAAWTVPKHLMPWFCPVPWSVSQCEIDLRPGGLFKTIMRSPEGKEFPNIGCFLEIVRNERLVWTDALLPGYRPSPTPFFTSMIELEPRGGGTFYRASAIHADEATRAKHTEMGFYDGWGKALDQLVAYCKTM